MSTEKVFYFPGQLGEAARYCVRVYHATLGEWDVRSEHLTYERACEHAQRLELRYGPYTPVRIRSI
jgi:hypothetical protein